MAADCLKHRISAEHNWNTEYRSVQMAFFQNRSLSLVDMYIDTSEPTENVGEIQFSLEYNFTKMTLIIRIMQVSNEIYA